MLSLILPTYCEAAVIEETLLRLSECLQASDYEILVVDDGSVDRTPQLVEEFAQRDKRVRLIRRLSKSGTAMAIGTGVEAAKGEVVATMNADLQHPPTLLPTMLDRVEQGCDIVIASRYVANGSTGMSAFRTLVSRCAISLARLLFPRVRAVRDPLAGFFMFRRSVTDGVQLMPSSSSDHVAIGLKFLLAMLVLGRYEHVCEVPCYMRQRRTGRSKFSSWDVTKYVHHLLFLSVRSGEARRLATFCAVGASAFVLYEAALFMLTDKLQWYYPVSAVTAWFLAFFWSFLLNDRLTFAGAHRRSSSRTAVRGLRFLAVKGVSLFLHLLILVSLTELVGLHYLASAAIAVALVVVWNYYASLNLVWGQCEPGCSRWPHWRVRGGNGS